MDLFGKLLAPVLLPVAKLGKVLFGAGWAQVARLSLIYAVIGIIGVEGDGIGEAAVLGVGTGLAV